MKLCLTTLVLLATLLLVEASPTPLENRAVYDCYDHPNPLKPHDRVKVACPPQDVPQFERRAGQMSYNGSNFFTVDLACTADSDTCNSVRSAFISAGEILSGVIQFTTTVVVNASYTSFCKTQGECSSNNFITLGGSYPARLLPMQNDDGLRRLHPQALVKQLKVSRAPQFGQYDINSMFNSDAPFWFRGKGVDIGPNQADFLFVILHEFIHGLGFTSSWNDYLNPGSAQALTPSVVTYTSTSFSQSSSTIFGGFQEYIFDRYMHTTSDNGSTSQLTRALNQFGAANSGNGLDTEGPTFASEPALQLAFQTSSQYALAQSMLTNATTSGSLAFVPAGSSSSNLLLETSIKPFASGSSVSHVDYNRYTGSADFLMRYLADRGVTLEDAISQGQGGPIGPGLIRVLESIGYTIQPGVDGKGPAGGTPVATNTKPVASNFMPNATPAPSSNGVCFFIFCSSASSDIKWRAWGVGTVVVTMMVLQL